MSIRCSGRALGACMVLSLSVSVAPLARAQVPGAGAAAGESPSEVVVTATRVAEPASEALEPIVIIDRHALEASLAGDVGDVLRFEAGLDIGRTGGPGQPLSLFIRGANSDQSIVMIDGVRINAGTLGGAPLQNLAPELFERIEIVEGPRSAIYGTDAIGGVVNLIPRLAGASGLDTMLAYGRYSTGEFAVVGNYTAGDTGISAALTGQQSNGFPTFAGSALDSGYKNWSGIAAAGTMIAGVELGGFYWRSDGTSPYAEPIYNADFTAFASFVPVSEHFFNSALALHAAGEVLDNWHARLTLSRIIDDISQNQAPDYDYTARDTLDLQNDVKFETGPIRQLATFGAILTSEQTNSLSFGTGYSIGTHTNTYYLQDQLETGPSRLLVAVGEYHHPAFGDHMTWNAEYGYQIAPGTLLIAAAGTAFRAPSATDRFGYGGTPNLLPESSRNFELGVKSRLTEQQQLSVAAFQDTVTDLIEFVPDPTNLLFFGENQNIDRARIRGLEASWQLHTQLWQARATASLQDPRDLTNDTQLVRRTKHSFTLSGSRRIYGGELGVDLLQAGERADIDVVSGAAVEDGSYLIAAVWGKLALTPDWSLTARLDNAFDRRYQLASGYNTAARVFSIATRYSLH